MTGAESSKQIYMLKEGAGESSNLFIKLEVEICSRCHAIIEDCLHFATLI